MSIIEKEQVIISEFRAAISEQWEAGYNAAKKYYAAKKENDICWKSLEEEQPENRVPILIVYEFVGVRYVSEGEWHRAHHQFLDYRFKEFLDEKEVVAWSPMPKFRGIK